MSRKLEPIGTELVRIDQHGVTRKELNRLIDDIDEWIFAALEARGVRAVRVRIEVDPEREAGQ